MKKLGDITNLLVIVALIASSYSCKEDLNLDTEVGTVLEVDPDLFLEGTTVSIVPCTLSNGTSTTCYQIVAGIPTDHQLGPWCPDNISDGAEAGGIWLDNGKVYEVDGEFVKNLASFYNDNTWKMYDSDGNIYKTTSLDDCINAANPNVGAAYKNFCVECVPEHITGLTRTWLIPTKPVKLNASASFSGPGSSFGASVRGIAFNGTEFSASAPVNNILGAYTLAPFDDAGGHINVHQGYHYHAATGVSTTIAQADGHAGMIGYAMDGHGIYAQLNEDGTEPTDLDGCRGHYDEVRGYHYHVDAPGANNFINCLFGAYIF